MSDRHLYHNRMCFSLFFSLLFVFDIDDCMVVLAVIGSESESRTTIELTVS